jgi:hypothetical protein
MDRGGRVVLLSKKNQELFYWKGFFKELLFSKLLTTTYNGANTEHEEGKLRKIQA